jgi:hypothetical protein
LDLPPLPTDNTNTQGMLHIAVCPEGDGWNGAAIYASNDGGEQNGNNFTPLLGIQGAATMGTITTNLNAGTSTTWDESNKFEVTLLYGSLISVNELALLNGANAAMVGDELLQFQNAELIGENTYRLSRLLRGRQGTEGYITNHSPGTRFVLLDNALHLITMPSNMIGKASHYKAVTVGNSLENTPEQTFTYSGNNLKPFAPVHLTSKRDKDGNITINWIRRSRLNNDWRDNVDIPIGEESEKYQVEIIDGGVVIKTLETSTPTIIYTTTEQIADFKILPKSITIKVYQLSTVVGRGYPAIATI